MLVQCEHDWDKKTYPGVIVCRKCGAFKVVNFSLAWKNKESITLPPTAKELSTTQPKPRDYQEA